MAEREPEAGANRRNFLKATIGFTVFGIGAVDAIRTEKKKIEIYFEAQNEASKKGLGHIEAQEMYRDRSLYLDSVPRIVGDLLLLFTGSCLLYEAITGKDLLSSQNLEE
jgi:hypothetical protein